MDEAKQQLVDKLKSANNVLVTVSRNPSVDQLSALIGLTLVLNKQGKHAAAVFSGEVPSTLEFLQPGETIEKNTDSLRDFIIALDKSKADKLRYKVEDDVVRIFITPYRTSISESDFDFSQGDFNVDVVVALGVQNQDDLDEAITTHGRILHDATVASVNTTAEGGLGSISWHQTDASSLSELVTDLTQVLGDNLLDEQVATALLTGIVAETDRFRNEKTSSGTMSASAALMKAGANQQLVASKLEEPPQDNSSDNEGDSGEETGHEGALDIDHSDSDTEESKPFELPSPEPEAEEQPEETNELPVETVESETPAEATNEETNNLSPGGKLITEAPTMGGMLTANTLPEGMDQTSDPLSLPNSEPPQLIDHKSGPLPATSDDATDDTTADQPAVPTPPSPAWTPPPTPPEPNDQPAAGPGPTQTLSDLEATVKAAEPEPTHAEEAREEINRAFADAAADGTTAPEPIQALNAQPLGEDLRPGTPASSAAVTPAPWENNDPGPPPAAAGPQVTDPTAPPPVPPPIPFQFGNQPPQQ